MNIRELNELDLDGNPLLLETPKEEDQKVVYRHITDEAICALGLDECEKMVYPYVQNAVFRLLVDCSQDVEPQFAIDRLKTNLIIWECAFKDDDLKQSTDKIIATCAKHILAYKMAQQSFENGEMAVTILPKIENFLARESK